MSVATERPAAAAAPPPPGGDPAPRPSRAGWLALAGIVAVAFAMLLYLGRTTSFFYDEWDWVLGRREWDLDALLAPHNEHLSLAPVLVFKALFSTVGTDSYVPYRVAGLVVHCGVAVLLFAYARRRVGDLLALGAAATILFLGTAWQDVLWPFQMGYLGSLAAGIGALLALDREDRRGDVTAAALLAVALASSSLGIPLLLAVAVEVLGGPTGARAGGSSPRPRCSTPPGTWATAAARARPRTTTSSGRPSTSPRRRRARPARCSRSGANGAARSRWGCSSRCS